MDSIINEIFELLRTYLPESLIYKVDEIGMLIKDEKYREAYLVMYELKQNKLWSPPSKYIQLMEKFWWNYAN